ncbi:hypothetical protein H4R27_006143 [Coemansia aciculifera]|nr:hypothetical protein H4R27_006143 [Coemansia aciculifera]
MSSFLKKVTRSARKTGHAVGFVLGLKNTFTTLSVSVTVSVRQTSSHLITAPTRNKYEYEDDEVTSEWPEPVAVRSLWATAAIFEAREKAIECANNDIEEREMEIERANAEIKERERTVRYEISRVEEYKEELARAYDTIKRYEDNAKRIEADIKEPEGAVERHKESVYRAMADPEERETSTGAEGRVAIEQATLVKEALQTYLAATALSRKAGSTVIAVFKSLEFAVDNAATCEGAIVNAKALKILENTTIPAKRLLEVLKTLNYAQYIANTLNKRKETATKVDAVIATAALMHLDHTVTFVYTQLEAVFSEPAFGNKAIRSLKFDIVHAKGCLDMISSAGRY